MLLVELCALQKYTEVITPHTSNVSLPNVILFGNRVVADVIRWVVQAFNLTSALITKEDNQGQTHTENTMWWQRPRMEWYSYKPRIGRDCGHHQKLYKGKEKYPLKLSDGPANTPNL